MPRLHLPPTLLAALLCGLPSLPATTLDRSTFTEVVNRVTVIDAATHQTRPARERDVLVAPNILRTGAESRAEMIAPDQTVTRVGANTIFSFARDSREMELQKGALLFQSPTGKGGGAIRTQAASAAVLGTTIIVAATRTGGMKVLLVEGKGKVTGPGGQQRILHAGQMVIIEHGGWSEVLDFRIREEVRNSRLVSGFHLRLPSEIKIARAEQAQQQAIDQGRLAPHDHRPPPPPQGDGYPPPPPPPPPRGGNQIGGAIPPPPPRNPPPRMPSQNTRGPRTQPTTPATTTTTTTTTTRRPTGSTGSPGSGNSGSGP